MTSVAADSSTSGRRTGATLRGSRWLVNVSSALFLQKEPKEPVGEDCEEDDRLLDCHEHPCELLVLERVEAPDAVVCVDVEVVDRVRDERHDETDRARDDESREHVGSTRARSELVWLVLED